MVHKNKSQLKKIPHSWYVDEKEPEEVHELLAQNYKVVGAVLDVVADVSNVMALELPVDKSIIIRNVQDYDDLKAWITIFTGKPCCETDFQKRFFDLYQGFFGGLPQLFFAHKKKSESTYKESELVAAISVRYMPSEKVVGIYSLVVPLNDANSSYPWPAGKLLVKQVIQDLIPEKDRTGVKVMYRCSLEEYKQMFMAMNFVIQKNMKLYVSNNS